MRGGRAREAFEIVAALEQRNEPSAAAPLGERDEALRHPGKIGFVQIEIAERIAKMGVETGRDDHQIGGEGFETRQDRRAERLAKNLAAVARA